MRACVFLCLCVCILTESQVCKFLQLFKHSHFSSCQLWSIPECTAFRLCQMSKDSHSFIQEVLSARLRYCFLCATTLSLWMSAMLSQGFESWLRCQDQLNACSDKRHDSRSRILPLSEPSGMFARYQHIYFTWSRQWAVRKLFWQAITMLSKHYTESDMIFTRLLMQNWHCDCEQELCFRLFVVQYPNTWTCGL